MGLFKRGKKQKQGKKQEQATEQEPGTEQRNDVPVRLAGASLEETLRQAPVGIAHDQAERARESGDGPGEARALVWEARALLEAGRAAEALTTAQRACEVARRTGDPSVRARAFLVLGQASARNERTHDAVRATGTALELFRRVGDREREGEALGNLSVHLMAADRYREAADRAQEGLVLVGHDPDQRCVAMANLGTALLGARRHADAVPVLREAAGAWRQLLDTHPDADRDVLLSAEATSLQRLGTCLGELERFDEAVAAWQQAAALFEECGKYRDKARNMFDIGAARLSRSRYDEAADAFRAAGSEYGDQDDRPAELAALLNLGYALSCAGRHPESVDAARRAVESARLLGDRAGEARARLDVGKGCAMIPGQSGEAAVCLEQALVLHRALGDLSGEAMATYLLGAVLTDMDRAEEGVGHSERAARLFRTSGKSDLEAGALRNLGIGRAKLNRR
ncbi:tetratricopeptide repeat protein [Kitasatospora sp. NPDC056446]|uniref:tetratricopeptide repeat protein n=1 Tax=Kitasatospora sp. NPDC056446 TaxID=3345819 RepID=UPI00367665E2